MINSTGLNEHLWSAVTCRKRELMMQSRNMSSLVADQFKELERRIE